MVLADWDFTFFVLVLPYALFDEGPKALQPRVMGSPPIVSMMFYVAQSNFINYRAIACESLLTAGIKMRKKNCTFLMFIFLGLRHIAIV